MSRARTGTLLLTTLWFVLASWQSVQGFRVCPDTSRTTMIYWSLYVPMLVAPMVTLLRRSRHAPATFDASWSFALLAYLPITMAMRLLEMCVTAG